MRSDPADVSAALIAYVSGGSRPYPTLDELAVVAAVGEVNAVDVLPLLQTILTESESVASDWMSRSPDPWRQVEDAMGSRYPDLTDEAIAALGRYWSYQMR